jgi:hypothetical protein
VLGPSMRCRAALCVPSLYARSPLLMAVFRDRDRQCDDAEPTAWRAENIFYALIQLRDSGPYSNCHP